MTHFLAFLKSFLNDRQQRVVLNAQSSNGKIARTGAQQGSVLGPLLFLIYSNDLSQGIGNIDNSTSKLNNGLIRTQDWEYKWKMSFNPERKTNSRSYFLSKN